MTCDWVVARPATNLSSVKRKIRRTAAGALAALALWSQCAVDASAELDLPPLRVDNCTGREQPSPALNAWHIDRLDMDRVWPIATGEGVRVAVIDTGTSNAGNLAVTYVSSTVLRLTLPSPSAAAGLSLLTFQLCNSGKYCTGTSRLALTALASNPGTAAANPTSATSAQKRILF